jgi:predicted metal-dependent enzyme (double-stranded beta helix superfamily)
MFSTERLIEDCGGALKQGSPEHAIKEIIQCAVSDAAGVARALGTPQRSEIISLYQSPELTILNVIWGPGMAIYPHDHRMWAVIGVYEGREDNTFFRRTAKGVERASARQLEKRDTALLDARTIHSVANSLGRFTCALQVYGGDFFRIERSEFDPETLEERPFDIERAKAVFLEANKRLTSA